MSKSQVLDKTIASLEKELQALKELKTTMPKKTSQKDILRGIGKGLNINDEEIEVAKIETKQQKFKSNYTAKDFYGFLKGFKIPEDKLEKELDKAKKLLEFNL